jgi:colicin import membrane protein
MEISRSYRKPLAFAIALHVILVIVLIVKLPDWNYRFNSGHAKTKIVHATAITSSDVKKAMHEIKYREQTRQREEQQRLAKLRQQAQQEKQRQQAAAVKVAKMKQEQLHLKQQHEKQVKTLAALKQKQVQMAKIAKQRAAKAKAAAKARALAAAKRHKQLLAAKQKELQRKLMMQQLAGDSKQLHQVQVNQVNGIVNKYAALIHAAIQQKWLVPGGADKNLSTVYDIQLAPDGSVISVKLVKSSGNQALDQSAKTAIYKASPLPVPQDPAAFDKVRDINLTLSPKNLIHS